MDYTQIKVNVDERVGVITLSHNPPRNSFTKRMLVEVCSGARSLANRARSVSNITPA